MLLATLLLVTIDSMGADPQHGAAGTHGRPAQPFGNSLGSNPYSAAYGQGRYTPYPVKDPTAAERVAVAGRIYSTTLDGWVKQMMAPPGPRAGPLDESALVGAEIAERLGHWSLRWQEAQDNAAKSLAGRYEALADHLRRMSSLEDGACIRESAGPNGSQKARPVESKPPRLVAEIARYFRPVDERGIDRVVPEIVEYERPLNPLGVLVTAAERAGIAGRAYESILDAAVDQFAATARAGDARRDRGLIFDAALAERLAFWSDMWRKSQDEAATDTPARLTGARNGPARLALAGERLSRTGALAATLRAHIDRMRALETGRFLDAALKREGRPAGERLDMTRFHDFAAVAGFFRIEAESQLSELSRPASNDAMTAAGRAAVAGQMYQDVLDEAARRYATLRRAGGATALAASVFDLRLAERLGSWSIRWARAQAGAGPDARFHAVRSHVERMAALADGRAVRDAVARADPRLGAPDAPTPPPEFADVTRFFRLEARWELELIRSR
jgi:hypothetical protein